MGKPKKSQSSRRRREEDNPEPQKRLMEIKIDIDAWSPGFEEDPNAELERILSKLATDVGRGERPRFLNDSTGAAVGIVVYMELT